jgi:hypothetical protein
MGKTKTAGVRHPVLESYGVIRAVDLLCPQCGDAVYHGSKRKDSADATLPKSIYACRCAYFSSSQLVLPLRQEDWEREVSRLAGDSALVGQGPNEAVIDPLLRAASEVNALHGELLAMGLEMIAKMIAIGEKLVFVKVQLGHGNWEAWVKANLTFTSRTARRYMEAFRHRDDPLLKDDPAEFLNRIHGNTQPVTLPNQSLTDLPGTSELTGDTDKSDVRRPICLGAPASPSLISQSKLSDAEKKELAESEAIIERGLPEALKVADAIEQLAPLKRIAAAEAIAKPETNKPKRQTKQQCWNDACERAQAALQELIDMQDEWRGIYEDMNQGLQNSAYGQKLNEITEGLDLQSSLDTVEKAAAADLPKGFGKD